MNGGGGVDEQANEGRPCYDGPRRGSSPASDDVTNDVIRQYWQVDVTVIGRSGDRRRVVLRGGRQTDLLLRLLAGRTRVDAGLLPVQLRRSTAATAAAPGLLRALRDDDVAPV